MIGFVGILLHCNLGLRPILQRRTLHHTVTYCAGFGGGKQAGNAVRPPRDSLALVGSRCQRCWLTRPSAARVVPISARDQLRLRLGLCGGASRLGTGGTDQALPPRHPVLVKRLPILDLRVITATQIPPHGQNNHKAANACLQGAQAGRITRTACKHLGYHHMTALPEKSEGSAA